MLHGDRDSVRRLISILLDNAVRHSDEGGDIRMEVCRKRGRASASLKEKSSFSGNGASSSSLESATKSFTSGLSMVQAIVQAHGGRIQAKRPDGERILIKASIPLAPFS